MKRLGVTAEQMRGTADFSSLLKLAKGGLKATLEALRFSRSQAAVSFVEAYDAIPARDLASLSWEAIAASADVDCEALVGAAVLAIQAHSANAVKLIALSNHPDVMRKRVEFAKLAGGDRDRNALDTILGALPTSKGSTFIINPLAPNQPEDDYDEIEPVVVSTTADVESQEGFDHLFPSLEKTQNELVPARARLIEATT